jgi:hypothetical protein
MRRCGASFRSAPRLRRAHHGRVLSRPVLNPTLQHPPPARLALVPGLVVALFVVRLDHATTVLSVPTTRLLEGLRTACDLLGFEGLQRDEERLDELLPWAGNV